jgi:tetratricopeptide (TPR) repeat protein
MKKLIPFALLLFTTSLAAQETVEETAQETVEETAQETVEETAEKTAEETAEKTAEETAEETVEETAEETQQAEAPTLDQVVPVAQDELMTVEMPPELSEEEELIQAYDRYVQLMKERVYDEADSVAKRVVELAIKVKGAGSIDFAKALSNLAIVQHRTEQYDAAQQNFESAIEIIENKEDQLDEQLINPLRGLGAAQMESGRPDKARESFRRAVHVTHVNMGPHNLEQVSILESLSETHLRMGSIDDAKHMQDVIYALNQRAYADNAMEMVPSLMRRADWQHRAGFINDQRTTLRRAIRIIEVTLGKDDMQLVDPLTQLGQSYFYLDLSGSTSFTPTSITTGETHFKRALRIARADPDANWKMIADTSLALGDFYNFGENMQQAYKIYRAAWVDLDSSEDRLAYRRENLEQLVTLRESRLPDIVSPPTEEAKTGQEIPLSQGTITIRYDVSERGRVENLKIVEAHPREFVDLHRKIQRELRRRIYRPRFTEEGPIDTEEQIVVHRYFYRQAELDALREPEAAESEDT